MNAGLHVEAWWVMAVAGPAFVMAGAWHGWRIGAIDGRSRAWLLVGLIFCVVAGWLWWLRGSA